MQANLVRIPAFISAGSPQGLRRAMLLNNARYGMEFRYFDIQYVNGRWFAWFLQDIPSHEVANELVEKHT